jgi:hypothetical protein
MKVLQPAGQLTLAYEALRAQATGELPAVTPRGLALFLAEGFPAWINTWKPLVAAPQPQPQPSPAQRLQHPPVGPGREIVQVLAEMALGCQKGWTA